MKRSVFLLAVSLAAVMLNGPERAVATQKAARMAFIDRFGYSRCIKLENENTEVVLCPEAGGRVLEYSWKGKNALYLDPAQNGWRYDPGKAAVDPCGGRFDVGPEMTTPRHPDLWLGKWSGEITGGGARLTSVEDRATGVQLVREFALDGSTSRLTCTQTIKNVSDKPISCCHWSRTLAGGGGIGLIPLSADSRFPKSYIMYGPGPVMNFQPSDPHIRTRNGFLEILGTPQRPKLGMDSHAGWFCYLLTNDLMFVKRFPTYPERPYCEMAGITISIWYYKDLMCELEPIGPKEKIAPGGSARFAEEWWLLPYRFPGKGAEVNLDEISQIVQRHAR